MDEAYSHYYIVNKSLLLPMGIWPYQTKLKKLLIRITIYIGIFSLFVPEFLGLVKSWGDVDATLECFPPLIILQTGTTLLTNCIYNMDKMEVLLSKIQKDWTTWTSGPEFEILNAYALKGKIFSIIFATLIFSNMLDYYALPLIAPFLDLVMPLNKSRTRKPLYITEYYVDQDDYFYWIFAHGSLTSTIFIVILVGVDAIFMVVIYHACGELAIIGFRLKSLLKTDQSVSSIHEIKLVEKINQEIKFCAQTHAGVIIFVNNICECFSTAYFLVLGFNMVIISITGVQTVMNLNHLSEATTFGAFALGQMFHLFCLSVPCQQLIDHSVELIDSIYNSYWYHLPPESRKMLIMIMRRSFKPNVFTAGKLYVFSMQNYASILRTSMSYFTVLSSVR